MHLVPPCAIIVPNELEVLPTKALTYIEHGKFALTNKPKPEILDSRDAVVRVTLGSICTSDLHIKHGSVPGRCPESRWAMRWWAWWKLWALL